MDAAEEPVGSLVANTVCRWQVSQPSARHQLLQLGSHQRCRLHPSSAQSTLAVFCTHHGSASLPERSGHGEIACHRQPAVPGPRSRRDTVDEAPLAGAGAGAVLDHKPTWGHRNSFSSTEVAQDPRSIGQKKRLKHLEPPMSIAHAPGTTNSCNRDAKESSHT